MVSFTDDGKKGSQDHSLMENIFEVVIFGGLMITLILFAGNAPDQETKHYPTFAYPAMGQECYVDIVGKTVVGCWAEGDPDPSLPAQ